MDMDAVGPGADGDGADARASRRRRESAASRADSRADGGVAGIRGRERQRRGGASDAAGGSIAARSSPEPSGPGRPAVAEVNLDHSRLFGVAPVALLRSGLGCLTARTRRGVRAAFRCCRCATSSCSRTWWCRCSSAAKNRSARSKRRWGRAPRAEGDLPVRAAQGEDQRADPRGHLHGRDDRARSSSCCGCPTAP